MWKKFALALLFVALGTVTAFAADVTGKWTASIETPRGTQQVSFDFKVDGAALTGKITTARGDADIQDGKVDGDTITFNQVVNFNGNEMKIAYKGAVSGDNIKFTRTIGDRPPAEFTAARAKP
jgi:opacity protein-like surface antigen